MKKVLFILLVGLLVGCQSTTEVDVQAADSTVVKAVDTCTKCTVDTLKK